MKTVYGVKTGNQRSSLLFPQRSEQHPEYQQGQGGAGGPRGSHGGGGAGREGGDGGGEPSGGLSGRWNAPVPITIIVVLCTRINANMSVCLFQRVS